MNRFMSRRTVAAATVARLGSASCATGPTRRSTVTGPVTGNDQTPAMQRIILAGVFAAVCALAAGCASALTAGSGLIRTRRWSRLTIHRLVVVAVIIMPLVGASVSFSISPASASATDCLSYGYACTPGYDGSNASGTWAWKYYGGSYAMNANGYHNCTLYAAWRLAENGLADPGDWGNAAQWAGHLGGGNHTPAVGSIAWWGSEVGGGYGHVAYVDQVNGTQVHIMADNYVGANGNGYTDSGWIAASFC